MTALPLFWDHFFPGKGAAITEVMGRFSGWRMDKVCSPKGLERRVRESRAIFWRQISGVQLQTTATMDLGAVVERLEDSLHAFWDENAGPSAPDQETCDLLERELLTVTGAHIRFILGEPFWFSLLYPCTYIVGEQPDIARQFVPLLDLWYDGFWPLGFDLRNRLVVIGFYDQAN